MALRLSTGVRDSLAGTTGLKQILDGGFMELYTGGQPVTANVAETGVCLARITQKSEAYTLAGTTGCTFGTSVAGVLPKGITVWSGTVGVAGVAGYFRFFGTQNTTGQGAASTHRRVDGNVGVSGSDLVLSNTTLVLGATVTIDSFSLEVPAS